MALDLEPIKARERHATKGPWKAKPDDSRRGERRCGGIAPDYHNHEGDDCYDYERPDYTNCPATDEIITTDSGYYGPNWEDAEFIAHAREDIPALVAEVEALRAREAQIEQLVEKWRKISGRPMRPTGFLICADELSALLHPPVETHGG